VLKLSNFLLLLSSDSIIVHGGSGGLDWSSMGEEECCREVIEPVRKALVFLVARDVGIRQSLTWN
jgi:hypothetical protein